MIHYKNGDLLEDDSQMFVNPVNCLGVMGKGLALQFRKKYPENYQMYRAACAKRWLKPGGMIVCDRVDYDDWPRYIANVATKNDWRKPSKEEWVESCLHSIAWLLETTEVETIALPALGCGLGGLEWERVEALTQLHLGSVAGVRINLYTPH
jgi:O-acetyl-ADP-ribose deacetylase (regulator of RNase III)